jgi:hypothetical protein
MQSGHTHSIFKLEFKRISKPVEKGGHDEGPRYKKIQTGLENQKIEKDFEFPWYRESKKGSTHPLGYHSN